MALGPCLCRICRAFEIKKYTPDNRFQGNGPYGKILTKKEPIKKLVLLCHITKKIYRYTHYLPVWSGKINAVKSENINWNGRMQDHSFGSKPQDVMPSLSSNAHAYSRRLFTKMRKKKSRWGIPYLIPLATTPLHLCPFFGLKNEFPSKVSPEEEKNSQSYQHDFGYCEVSQLMIDLYHPKLDRKNQNVAV